MHQPVGELSGFALGLLLLQGVDQLHGREEAHPLAMLLDGLNSQCRRDVLLASTGSADKHHIVSLLDEFTAMKAAYQGFIDLAVVDSTILQEFYQVAFRRKIYRSIDELQVDLDSWIDYYNCQRTHQDKM